MYLDHAATTPVRPEVLQAMWPYLTNDFGNPSSHHEVGEAAARGLTSARAATAAALGCRPSEVIFTSGGTEADNLAIKGIALGNPRGRHIVTTAIEHEAVLESCDYLRRHHGFLVEFAPLTREGTVDAAAFAALLRADTTLVTVMHASNEIGTVQPIRALAKSAREFGIPFHTDAVQSAGWLPVGLDMLGVDALSVSGHKLGAPKGAGVLAIRSGVALEPVNHGGGQERGRRSGTENVAGAVAMATALSLVEPHPLTAIARDLIIDGVLGSVPDAILTGHRTERLPNHASFCFPGTSGEAVLLELESRGVTCSSGSACAAGSDEPSHVLVALGIDPAVAQTAVRFTLGADLTSEQAREVVAKVAAAVAAVGGLGAR